MQQQQNLILQFEMEKGENHNFVHDYDDWKEMCW